MEDKMTKEEIAFRKRLEALPQMTNREAMEIVLRLASLGAQVEEDEGVQSDIDGMNNDEAIYRMQDYMNDLMREEPATGCDYGIGG